MGDLGRWRVFLELKGVNWGEVVGEWWTVWGGGCTVRAEWEGGGFGGVCGY